MDKALRNTLRNTVTECRRILEEAMGQVLQGQFGVHPTGEVEPDAQMAHLSDEDQTYRSQVLAHLKHIEASGLKPKDAVAQLVREAAFTHLNRLCAFKMMEARGFIREAVSRGLQSQGFMFYLADHPEDEALWSGGEQYTAYRHFLRWLGETLSDEIGVLFSPADPATRLFPQQRALELVLNWVNSAELRDAWQDDEALGWVYQYFTPKEVRDKSHAESRAPRSSYELAFRNQFYTPDYVVRFLTDNTLGRIWYEMRRGDTALATTCSLMVRRQDEVFLAKGERESRPDAAWASIPPDRSSAAGVQVRFRAKKDPRDIRVLDPACGSGHFLLYCFDVLQTVYAEAYTDPDLGQSLRFSYPTPEDLKKAVPGLILTHNLHGIDIDPRATQIAALALWLRAQRSYQEMGLPNSRRPKIARSNVVCAEPMPGDEDLLDQFAGELQPPILGQLFRVVFRKTQLAGEAGSLLKIEEEIRDVVAGAKAQWLAEPVYEQRALFDEQSLSRPMEVGAFDFSGVTDEEFWDGAENRVLGALHDYASRATNGTAFRRQLFADDAVRGFAFIDVCRRRFDVVVMNPPFGAASKASKCYVDRNYPTTKGDLLANFIERALDFCAEDGLIGAISSRTCFFLGSLASFRTDLLGKRAHVLCMADMGDGVLEAMVETAAYVLGRQPALDRKSLFYRVLLPEDKQKALTDCVVGTQQGRCSPGTYVLNPEVFALLAGCSYAYWVDEGIAKALRQHPRLEGHRGEVRVGLQTSDDPRFLRLVWEIPADRIALGPASGMKDYDELARLALASLRTGKRWAFYSKADAASPWVSPLTLVVDWEQDGKAIKDYARSQGDSPSRSVRSEDRYFRPGFSYMLRSTRLVPYVVTAGVIPTAGRSQVYPEQGQEIPLLGFCASNAASAVARFNGEKFAWPKFQASMVRNLPVPALDSDLVTDLTARIEEEVRVRRAVLSRFEPFQEFARPAFLDAPDGRSTRWSLYSMLGEAFEARIGRALGLSEDQLLRLESDLREAVLYRSSGRLEPSNGLSEDSSDDQDKAVVELVDESGAARAQGMLSYCLGVVFGRWDVRFAKDPSLVPMPRGIFTPPPPTPPGALVGPDGLPAQPDSIASAEWLRARRDGGSLPPSSEPYRAIITEAEYPLRIDWDGMLVADPGHTDDVASRIGEVLTVIFGASAEQVERELVDACGSRDLGDYFQNPRPGGFWLDHLKRYSMNRRKAPIYWLLQSTKRSYALWLYCHRLDGDTLFKALVNYVEPKIRLEHDRLRQLQSQRALAGTSGREARQLEKQIDRQEALLSELHDFHDRLRRAANLQLKPDLNDGVVLNIAPLWELVPWDEPKKYWEELLAGKYEWSSIGKQLRAKGLVK